MLTGEFQHSMDAKGRIFVPARMRDELGKTFFVTKGLDGCLYIFSSDEYNKMMEKFDSTSSIGNKKMREVKRYFVSTEVEPDKQGRILLPPSLREKAELQKDVVVIGMGNHAEIWDLAKWNAYNEANDEEMTEIVEQLVDLGI